MHVDFIFADATFKRFNGGIFHVCEGLLNAWNLKETISFGQKRKNEKEKGRKKERREKKKKTWKTILMVGTIFSIFTSNPSLSLLTCRYTEKKIHEKM